MNSRYEFSQLGDFGAFSIFRIFGNKRIFAGLLVSNPVKKRWDIHSHDRNESKSIGFIDSDGGEPRIVPTSEVKRQAGMFLDRIESC